MPDPRKILILTNRVPYPLKDGGNLAMNAMIEGYHRAGWQVHLLVMNTSRHRIKREQLQKLFTHLHAFEWVDIDNHLKWTEVLKNYLFSDEPEHAIRFYKEEFKDKLKEVLHNFRPDAVQVESVYLHTYMPVIKENSDAITVLRVHNIEYQVWQGLAAKTTSRLKRIYLNNLAVRIRNFERKAWREYDLLLAITDKDAQLISRLEIVKDMIVAPFGIDMSKIMPGRNERWVGYHIGAMDWIANRDGVRWFIDRAWPKTRRAVPEFEFYFAGRAMPADFKNLNVKGVYCMDEVPSAEEFIADKKILIVPLFSGGGIRIKILEAMAAGKVVITTSAGIKGIDAQVRQHYLLANKSDEFAKAIKWCIEHKGEAEQMAGNARDLVKEKYEYTKVIGTVIEEVERLIIARKA